MTANRLIEKKFLTTIRLSTFLRHGVKMENVMTHKDKVVVRSLHETLTLKKSIQTFVGRTDFSTTWRKRPVAWSRTQHNVAVVGRAAFVAWKSQSKR